MVFCQCLTVALLFAFIVLLSVCHHLSIIIRIRYIYIVEMEKEGGKKKKKGEVGPKTL